MILKYQSKEVFLTIKSGIKKIIIPRPVEAGFFTSQRQKRDLKSPSQQTHKYLKLCKLVFKDCHTADHYRISKFRDVYYRSPRRYSSDKEHSFEEDFDESYS